MTEPFLLQDLRGIYKHFKQREKRVENKFRVSERKLALSRGCRSTREKLLHETLPHKQTQTSPHQVKNAYRKKFSKIESATAICREKTEKMHLKVHFKEKPRKVET